MFPVTSVIIKLTVVVSSG